MENTNSGKYIYTLTAEQKTARNTHLKSIKVEIHYTLGGANYFSGGYNKRGYRLLFTPCNITQYGMESVLLGSGYDSGFYIMLEETKRKSDKVFKKWASMIDFDKVARLCADANNMEIVAYIDRLNAPVATIQEANLATA